MPDDRHTGTAFGTSKNHAGRIVRTPVANTSPQEQPQAGDNQLLSRIETLERRLSHEREVRWSLQQRLAFEAQHTEKKVKNHLSYRLGREIVECGVSPLAWTRLPFRLARAYREYRVSLKQKNAGSQQHDRLSSRTAEGARGSSLVEAGFAPETQEERARRSPVEMETPASGSRRIEVKTHSSSKSFAAQTTLAAEEAKETPNRLNVLSILDEFSHTCFQDVFNLIAADRDGWPDQLESLEIDFLFAESAWRGNNGAWNYSMSKFSGKFGDPLRELLRSCNERNIPTVFWNKEDPLNYHVFIDVARHFDYIFTTDETLVSQYQDDVGHNRVYVLPFAASETLHNPIVKSRRNGRVAFAGSWHGVKYPLRAARIDMLFEYARETDLLDIFDRHSDSQKKNDNLTFPSKYSKCLLPAVPYDRISEDVYKKYSVVLNVNSVETSGTMLARRIYELCGCGTPILSSQAVALEGELSKIVHVANSTEQAKATLERLLRDELYALKRGALGVRFAHSRNTYRHRAKTVASAVLPNLRVSADDPINVTAICVSKRPWFAASVANMLQQQVGVNLSVIYVAHGDAGKTADIEEAFSSFGNFKFVSLSGDDTVLADGLNLASDLCETDIVAKIDDDDYYGPHYLLDSCLALNYSRASIVGKASYFAYVESTDDFTLRFPDKHYRYFRRVQGGTLVWKKSKVDNVRFTRVKQGTDTLFIKGVLASGGSVFSADPFNFVHVRHATKNSHTWRIDDQKFLEATVPISKGKRLDIAFA